MRQISQLCIITPRIWGALRPSILLSECPHSPPQPLAVSCILQIIIAGVKKENQKHIKTTQLATHFLALALGMERKGGGRKGGGATLTCATRFFLSFFSFTLSTSLFPYIVLSGYHK